MLKLKNIFTPLESPAPWGGDEYNPFPFSERAVRSKAPPFLTGFILLVYLFLFLSFDFCQAAILYLRPQSREIYLGDIFIEEIKIDTEGECVNTVEANLNFPRDILEVVDFSQGGSIITLWVKQPEINQEKGKISFSGGIPGGYCGILPGEPGVSNVLGKIIFQFKKISREPFSGKVEFLDSSQVLLNDGLGTPAKLTTEDATFTILPEKVGPAKKEWQEELEKDIVPPEPFEIEIYQDPTIFEGKYFIIFSTTDKQTGIDYYEVKEGKRDWKRAESPYLLEDQSLKSIIKVKAVDKAGNEQIAEYMPPYKITWKDWLPWIILVLIVGGVIWYSITKQKRKRTQN